MSGDALKSGDDFKSTDAFCRGSALFMSGDFPPCVGGEVMGADFSLSFSLSSTVPIVEQLGQFVASVFLLRLRRWRLQHLLHVLLTQCFQFRLLHGQTFREPR